MTTKKVVKRTDSAIRKMKGYTWKEFLQKDIPSVEYLVEGVIPSVGISYIFGSAGSFKTSILLYVAVQGRVGHNVLNFKVKKPFRTVWIDEENGEIGMHHKMNQIINGCNLTVDDVADNAIFIYQNFKLLNKETTNRLDEIIEKTKANMIVIDSIAKVFDGDERSERDVARIFDIVKPVIEKHKIAVVFIHHSRKLPRGQKSGRMEDIAGSREFAAMPESMIYLQSISDKKFLMKQTKLRNGKKFESVNFSVKRNDKKLSITFEGTVGDSVKKHRQKIAEVVKAKILDLMINNPQEEYKSAILVKAMKEQGWKETNIRAGLKLLVDDDILASKLYGKYTFLGARK